MLGRDDVAGDAEQPGAGNAALGLVGRGRVDRGEEHVGGEISGEVRVVDAADDELLHRLDVFSVEGLQYRGVGRDTRQVGVVHISSWSDAATALRGDPRRVGPRFRRGRKAVNMWVWPKLR
jgi:hypothetical protein